MVKRQIHRLLFMHIAFLPVAHLLAVLECVTGIKIEWRSKQATQKKCYFLIFCINILRRLCLQQIILLLLHLYMDTKESYVGMEF